MDLQHRAIARPPQAALAQHLSIGGKQSEKGDVATQSLHRAIQPAMPPMKDTSNASICSRNIDDSNF
jgi:hypothetical protein